MSKAIGMEETHSFTLTWELDIDTNDMTTALTLPMSTRFGEAILTVKVKAPQHLELDCDWSTWPIGCVGRKVTPSFVLDFVDPAGGASSLSLPDQWNGNVSALPGRGPQFKLSRGLVATCDPEYFADGAEEHPDFDPKQHRRFRFRLMFLDVLPAAYIATAPLPPKPMRAAVASISSQCPNNLRLFFPRSNAELWTNAEALAEASPYFKTMLSLEVRRECRSWSEEGEDGQRARAEGEGEQAAEDGAEGGADDSDDETDDFIKQSGATGAGQEDVNPDIAYREVTITESAYSTYRAVLVYLHTSHITFAPLSSSFLPSLSSAGATRAAWIQETAETKSSLPLPVSPKAVYALAHLLELPSLMALALADLQAQLTVESAAVELFSETSSLYDDMRDTVLNFVIAHWAQIKGSEGMLEVKRQLSAGELPRAGPIFALLIDRI